MATLNTSSNGPSITKSYQSIVNAPAPSGAAAKSPSYGQWAVFSVSAPLVNAFQQDSGGKESVLKVQSTGEGELVDLVDEFSDGRIQFAFVKVRDPNTTLPKSVLVGWCGEGVPERTKGYFTSHMAAVAKVLHGYHVQITARSDRDLTPEGIIQKVAEASGSKYSGGGSIAPSSGPPPSVASKPVFQPTKSSGVGGFNPLASLSSRNSVPKDTNVDEDGWGHDAPPVTRTQLEKVQPHYQPTKVNLRDMGSQQQGQPHFNGSRNEDVPERTDVVKGAYQPVGKVDIAALRRQAQETASKPDDRPTVVKGAYEPVGKVDIAAIRARVQPPSEGTKSPPVSVSPAATGSPAQSSLPDRSAPFSTSERLTSLPKPKVGNKFGSSSSSFTGTKAPSPGVFGLESKPAAHSPPVGVGRTFADQSGKTPAQIWAEKKARERGVSGASDNPPSAGFGGPASPLASQTSGGGEWKSGYTGKSWGAIQTTKTGQSASSIGQQNTGNEVEPHVETPDAPVGGVGAIRDRFKNAAPMGAAVPGGPPPPLDTSNKPNAGRGVQESAPRMPIPPPQPPRGEEDDEDEEEPGSPIQVAMPVARGEETEVEDARKEQFSPPPAMPARSMAQAIPHEDDLTEEPHGADPARGAGVAAAAASFGEKATEAPSSAQGGQRAIAQYDYEKAEDNELELKDGEHVTNIEMVDEDWWMGTNERGESGLFPSNYVELVEDDAPGHSDVAAATAQPAAHEAHAESATTAPAPPPAESAGGETEGAVATALYDYEAAEDNELSFPENAKITNVEFPDDDWWSGEYAGHSGLFPSNYVQLDE